MHLLYNYPRCIAAYALVVLPTSTAHLYKRRMTDDKEGHLGFGVQATRDIVKGEYVYELSGLLAIDNDTPHTRLSETTPFGNSSEEQRVFFGPIRFVNHQCIDFNAEVSHLDVLGSLETNYASSMLLSKAQTVLVLPLLLVKIFVPEKKYM